MRYVVCFTLLSLVHTSSDCVTSHWTEWSPCLPLSNHVHTLPDNVGQRIRFRGRVLGRRCILKDLEEVKLCLLQEDDPFVESGSGRLKPVVIKHDVDTTPNLDTINGDVVSGGPIEFEDVELDIVPNVGSVINADHVLDEVSNRVLIISVSTVLGLALAAVGVVLLLNTKRKRRQSKIRSVTRERIELLEVVKKPAMLHNSVKPSWLCGTVQVVGDLTVYNEHYLSESESETENMSLGRLEISVSRNERI